MKKKIAIAFWGAVFLLLAAQANALTIGSPDTTIWGPLNPEDFVVHGGYDYGDAIGYGEAKNLRGQWQGLGKDNSIDDGVKWSVGGSTFGTDADLIIGEEVTFKFLFWQLNNGRHDYDQIIAFFDFGQDFVFDNPLDRIFYEKLDAEYVHDTYDVTRTKSEYTELTLTLTIPETTEVGSAWLRARAHCNHTQYPYITAYNTLGQGETEDYRFNIVAAPVPEPSTMVLFGLGILGIAGITRRKK